MPTVINNLTADQVDAIPFCYGTVADWLTLNATIIVDIML